MEAMTDPTQFCDCPQPDEEYLLREVACPEGQKGLAKVDALASVIEREVI